MHGREDATRHRSGNWGTTGREGVEQIKIDPLRTFVGELLLLLHGDDDDDGADAAAAAAESVADASSSLIPDSSDGALIRLGSIVLPSDRRTPEFVNIGLGILFSHW